MNILRKHKEVSSQKVVVEKFLSGNIDFFINHFSYMYPIGEQLLEEYKAKWNWELLSCNENLYWSIDLIEKFENSWHWESLSGNEKLPWSDELIIMYADKWTWNKVNAWDFCLMDNNSIKWTYNILKAYPDRINWDMISADSELINNNPAILSDFPYKLDWESLSGNEGINFTEDLIDKFETFWNWEYLSGNGAIDWNENLIAKYKSRINQDRLVNGNDELWLNIKYSRSIGKSFSNSDSLKQSDAPLSDDKMSEHHVTSSEYSSDPKFYKAQLLESLEQRVDNLDWESASLNKSLPWSEELIEKYKDKWEWGHKEEREDGSVAYAIGLTSNPSLPWSIELIKKFQDYWFWPDLSYSESVPWSLELIIDFHDKWDWGLLKVNKILWQKVFYPFIDPGTIRKLLSS